MKKFSFLIFLSMVTLAFLVFADRYLEKRLWSKKIANYLENFSDQTTVILQVFTGVAAAESKKIAQSRIPALYIGLGFSLCWVALEKLFFPGWGLDVLREQPKLAMGLPHDFFLMARAFVEMSLGYFLVIGVIQRPLALTITLAFFATSAFFGKTEIIGYKVN